MNNTKLLIFCKVSGILKIYYCKDLPCNFFCFIIKVLEKYGEAGYEKSDIPPIFDHYFRHLYRILKYIDQSQDLDGWAAKYKYIGIVRGQLSRYELVWLYFNSLFY